MEIYKKYLHQFRFTYLSDDYFIDKFVGLKSLSKEQLKNIPPILVEQMEGNCYILDGVHRAAVMLYNGIDKINCVVFEQ